MKVNNTLNQLNLGFNQISDTVAEALAESLKVNNTLTQPILAQNKTSEIEAEALAESLKVNNTVMQHDVRFNHISTIGAEALAELMKANNTLNPLNIGFNQLSDAGAEALAESIKRPSQFIMASKIVQTLLAKKLKEAPKFEGKFEENVLKWLKSVGNAFKLATLDDSTKLALIANYLGGEASEWYLSNMDNLDTWSKFCIEIAKTYSSPAAKQLAARQLQSPRQGLQESVMHYYNDILQLCETMDSQMTDQSKLIYLLQGLKLSLHKEAARQEPKTPLEFIQVAQKRRTFRPVVYTSYAV
ncbi:unnamed protein product, partial [Didymodactylos carnosus]